MRRVIIFLSAILILAELGARIILIYQAAPAVGNRVPMSMTDYGVLVYDDYRGQIYTIVNHERLVTDRPAVYDHTLWLFGNSTTFDFYTTDADTMASQLQRTLNQSGYRWRVRNEGVSGMKVSGELARLKHEPVQRGDKVVFLDGWMESWFNPDECSRLRLATAELACRSFGPRLHGQVNVTAYWTNIEKARTYTQQIGASFYHLVQPVHNAYLAMLPSVVLPDDDYVDQVHLNTAGDSRMSTIVYDILTLI